jgi:hypothetical protein
VSQLDSELREWRESVFVQLVSDGEVRQAASTDLHVELSDLEAARPYLRKCLVNMSTAELEHIQPQMAALPWARGALGQAQYRRRRGKRKRHPRGERQQHHRGAGSASEQDDP